MFKLVPVEATEEMLAAIWGNASSHVEAQANYQRMLAAAPAAVAAERAKTKGLSELIEYFRTDGMSLGNEGDLAGWYPCETALHGLRRADAATAEVERLRTALTPFAELLTELEEDGDYPPLPRGKDAEIEVNISVKALRNARAALAADKQEKQA